MRNQTINFREERDLGQKLNATFAFIRQNFKVLFTCTSFFVLPFALLAGIFTGIYQSRLLQIRQGDRPWKTWGEYDFFYSINSFNYLASLFFTLISFILISLTIYSFIVCYMDNDGKVTVGDVWEGIKNNFLTSLYSALGIFILCLMGYVILLVPGIYLSVAFSLFLVVMIREEVGFVEGIERSLYLVKDYWWPTLGLLLVVGLIQAIMGAIVYLPAMVLGVLQAFKWPGADNGFLLITVNSIATVGAVLLYSISITAVAFQYFNLVEIKDGVGLMQQVDLIGRPALPAETDEHAY